MKKAGALIITFFVIALIAGDYLFFNSHVTKRQTVIVARVIDGDTFETSDGTTVRLLNVNTPEKKEAHYAEAKAFTEQLVNRSVEIEPAGTEKYGRLLGKIYAPNYFNLALVREGLAHTLLVGDDEAKLFSEAESQARMEEKGIWRHSKDYGCLKGTIDSTKEVVSLIKICNISVVGWTVKDETTHSYTITRDFSTLSLFSAKGVDNDNGRYWGRGSIWNDNRDSLFIRDTHGDLVYFYQYGYR